jgi:cell fate regulator YaaT (PSP1 superfamily)
MSCGSGGCASGGCGLKASLPGHAAAAGEKAAGSAEGAGGCSNGACGNATAFDGTYRDVVGVRIGAHARTWYLDSTGYQLVVGESCVVEGEHSEDFARVVQATGPSRKFAGVKGMRRVLRRAAPDDEENDERCLALRREALLYCREKIAQLHLDMKLADAEPSFDGRRLTFAFTSDDRVDFRELVRDLSQQFRRRIEMRQIGARDEAGLLGGYGICGRPTCCSTFLTDFPPISIKMAKRQGIGMNPSKISGLCGRLMCCLRYEDYDDPKNPVPGPVRPAEAPAAPAAG